MSEKQTDFRKLSEAVISELKSLEYIESSLTNYRRLYARIGCFWEHRSIKEYSPAVGKAFIAEYYPCDTHRRRLVLLMIRRLDDHLNNIPYRCHRTMKTPDVPYVFVGLLDDYLEYCIEIGNKPGTVRIKKDFCLIFLHFLSDIGCNDISEITADIVAKSCLIYTNKEGYAALRQFLRYLFQKELITKDLSAVVPHYKRRQIVPSVFTPEEIKRMEDTIILDTPTGKRQFLGYLNLNEHQAFIPVIPKVHDDYSPYIFSDEELELIFRSADNTIVKDKKACIYLPIEFPVILRLLFGCGLRIGETIKIQMKDVDLENGVLKLVNTKGDKHRLVPMSEKMTDILTKYCLAMGLVGDSEAWLFPWNDTKSHISSRSVKNRFERILKDNGIELKKRRKHERGPCLHCMRHVFAFKSFRQKSSECP